MDADRSAAASENAVDAVLAAMLDFEVAERTAMADLARRFSLNDSELTTLALLARSGTQHVTRLAALLQLTAGSTSSLISRLSERDLILRHRSEHDRRSVELTLTDSGRAIVQAMHARFRTAVRAALADTSDDCLIRTSAVLRTTAADLLHDTTPDSVLDRGSREIA